MPLLLVVMPLLLVVMHLLLVAMPLLLVDDGRGYLEMSDRSHKNINVSHGTVTKFMLEENIDYAKLELLYSNYMQLLCASACLLRK